MNARETLEVRDLTATELDEVSGGVLGIVVRLAVGIGMTIIQNQDHNGGKGTITMGELLQRHGY
jgi:hypothetical protein